ncbi:unnamed protein product, partial [Iphiclides podalirius]
MSVFNELLPKIKEISNAFTKNFNEDLKESLKCFDKFEEEFQNGKSRTREKALKDKSILTTLQSINEDEVESNNTPEEKPKRKSSIKPDGADVQSNTEDETQRASKKRSKDDVDDMSSPEQEKRQKRNASVKAQSIISKQVNVNLMQKLRREDSLEKNQSRSKRRDKDEEKENTEPVAPLVQVKQEKISLPPEPMDQESLPINVEVKQELDKDEIAMPPPAAPVPKPRRAVQKEKSEDSLEEDTGKRRTTRTRKPKRDTEVDTTIPIAPVASSRSTRASSRATRLAEAEEAPKDSRPKRTRGRKKVSESTADTDKDSQSTQDSGIGSPAEKPRPKRTRKAQKAAEGELPKEGPPKEPETASPKETKCQADVSSPILQHKAKINLKTNAKASTLQNGESERKEADAKMNSNAEAARDKIDGRDAALDRTHTINGALDTTVVLPNGVYDHAPITPKNVRNMNETVVIATSNRETIVLDKTKNLAMEATVVLERLPQATNLTEDNSLLTDDEEPNEATTPQKQPPNNQPSSAVKEKVQQFEQLASRITRTKTRAMVKKDEPAENQTPPDKVSKVALSTETLTKMNSMIFNGKASQISSSASKPKSNIPTMKPLPSSTSKLSGINKAKEAAEEFQKKEKEDARRKKEALLEAKREMQRKKREEKMAAAAAAREAAERERQAAMEAAARERMEKQAHADQGKLERLKETERRKQELARKAAETEERRRAEEQARAQRLGRRDAPRRRAAPQADARGRGVSIPLSYLCVSLPHSVCVYHARDASS